MKPGDNPRELRRSGIRWAELLDGTYVMAPILDRPATEVSGTLVAGEEGLVAGRVLPLAYRPDDLVDVPVQIRVPGIEERDLKLRREALRAFEAMIADASKEGLYLGIQSAFRTAEYQKALYARKTTADPSQNVSAAPGRSEHQLGTAADVTTPAVGLEVQLENTPEGEWIRNNCERYNLILSFSRERYGDRGVAFEPWHLRWVGSGGSTPSTW